MSDTMAAEAGALALDALVHGVDRYLAGLSGPGIRASRRGIAPALQAVAAPRPGAPNGVVARWLGPALGLLAAEDPALAAAIGDAAPQLGWVTYDAYGPEIGPHFPRTHAYASLVGGVSAPFPARPGFNLGLFLVAPRTLYRDHRHLAPELYAPLTGPHSWRFTPGARFRPRPAHVPVWNPANRPHATLTGAAPFLALYAWTRDLASPAVVLPADDWARYEGAPQAPEPVRPTLNHP